MNEAELTEKLREVCNRYGRSYHGDPIEEVEQLCRMLQRKEEIEQALRMDSARFLSELRGVLKSVIGHKFKEAGDPLGQLMEFGKSLSELRQLDAAVLDLRVMRRDLANDKSPADFVRELKSELERPSPVPAIREGLGKAKRSELVGLVTEVCAELIERSHCPYCGT